MRLGDEAFPPWARGGRRTRGKERQCVSGKGQAPGVAEPVEDCLSSRTDGRLHGSGCQLDRHGDGAGDPERRAHGTTAAGEGATTPASTAVPSAARQQAPIPCARREGPAALAAHGLRSGLPQRESGFHRRVLGHSERARLRAAPRATGSPPRPQPYQEG